MKKIISMLLLIAVVISTAIPSFAQTGFDLNKTIAETAVYLQKTIPNPQVGSTGGEWAIMGLARSGEYVLPEYYENYFRAVEEYVAERGGILHAKKYTEYSRLITALTSMGKNPADIGGYNLLTPLGDYEKTIWQGINGAVWALIALDCGNYDIPQNPDAAVQATRQMYVDRILGCQLSDGGWSLSAVNSDENTSDTDITAMALQALSKYRGDERVQNSIDNAIRFLSQTQLESGGFSNGRSENSESTVQVIVALCELGISINDERFVKSGHTTVDALMTYRTDENAFLHTHDGSGSDPMATEQAFYAMAALKRAIEGKNSLYTMSDASDLTKNAESELQKSYSAPPEITYPLKTFEDIASHKDKAAIEALTSRGIINGKTETAFEPDSTMTRAEFAAIITRGLALPQKDGKNFSDVDESDWFFSHVGTAYAHGIIKGVSESEFNPHGTISREEAAVMIQRAAQICGIDTVLDSYSVRNILSQFSDYTTASEWATASLAFCYDKKILSDTVFDIKPSEAILRGEIASMLYKLLKLLPVQIQRSDT